MVCGDRRGQLVGVAVRGAGGCIGIEELAHAAELVVAAGEEFVGGLVDQLAERCGRDTS